jgi:hypothetical protein
MFQYHVFLLCFALANDFTSVQKVARLEDVFQTWEKARKETRTLFVEFDKEVYDPVFHSRDSSRGVFKLLQTEDGEVCAALQPYKRIQSCWGDFSMPENYSGLLRTGKIYLLDHDQKVAGELESSRGTLAFLEEYLNPLIVLVNRKRADAKNNITVDEFDKYYTYLRVKPKRQVRNGFFSISFVEGRVAVMNQGRVAWGNANPMDIPKGIPCQLWYCDTGGRSVTINIRTWWINAPGSVDPADFRMPQDRPGWTVYCRGVRHRAESD